MVQKHGFSLKFCSDDLRGDRHVVRCALQQTGCALAHAAEELRSDKAREGLQASRCIII